MSEPEKPFSPAEQAALVEAEARGLKRCGRHPVEVFFDGEVCPACEAARQWLALTDNMKSTGSR